MNLSVIVGGVEYSLDDGTLAWLVGFDGWGMAPTRRLSERGPLQHGESDVGFRLDARYGTLVFRLNETTLAGMFEARNTLIGLFSPLANPILKWNMDYGERRIDCHYAGEMGMAWSPQGWAAQAVTVRLKAADPTFYDPNPVTVTFGLTGGSEAFEIPLEIPWAIGASVLDQSVTVRYDGNWRTYPQRIRIEGPIDDAVITNVSTDEKLDFSGVTIADGEYYDIDCRYGYKTVVDQDGANQIAGLTEDSDLATWHLAPSSEVANGDNDLRVTGSDVDAGTEVHVQYYNRYLGV